MIEMVHKDTGVTMWVHEDNVKAYLEMGHKLALSPVSDKPTKKPVRKKKPQR